MADMVFHDHGGQRVYARVADSELEVKRHFQWIGALLESKHRSHNICAR
jgi:hypothetical protein